MGGTAALPWSSCDCWAAPGEGGGYENMLQSHKRGLESQLCHSLAGGPWASHFTSPSLSFPMWLTGCHEDYVRQGMWTLPRAWKEMLGKTRGGQGCHWDDSSGWRDSGPWFLQLLPHRASDLGRPRELGSGKGFTPVVGVEVGAGRSSPRAPRARPALPAMPLKSWEGSKSRQHE